MSPVYRNAFLWMIIAVLMILLFNLFNNRNYTYARLSYTKLVLLVDNGKIKKANFEGNDVYVITKDGKRFKSYVPEVKDIADKLAKNGVAVNIKPPQNNSLLTNILIYWAPMIVFIFLWFYFMNQMNKGGKALSFGKSNARMFISDPKNRITFKDVAGIDEVKDELLELIEFLKSPKKFTKIGAKIPKGVLLVGAPGTGKTLVAKAVAGEAGVPFFTISGSDFVEMFVGVGASRVRDLFNQAKRNAPCIVFIDEIDAVGRQRGAGVGGGNDEREQTLNQLLVEMDGFQTDTNIIVMAATNRPDVLDPALLRPGRFDRRIVVPKPDVKGRLEILKVHTRKIPLGDNVDLEVIAKSTSGFVGADLANLVNEAALIAARRNKSKVEMEDFDIAKDKVLLGPERKNVIISEREKRITAYHESGHAIVAKMLPNTDPVHKVSIIPRGMALGVTQQLPEDDKYTYDKDYLINRMAVLMGGRAAEEVMLNNITTGAGNDIERATEIARKMVCEWGMSSLGPIHLADEGKEVFLGRDIAVRKSVSEETAKLIDNEVRKIVEEAYSIAVNIIKENRDKIEKMAQKLLEKEVLDAKEIDEIVGVSDDRAA
ncbi:ATP-dependent zinc metalloprotease FtsH [Hippea maritima]|uniref:ATP-dependent zinc metalloprotease FtsH n=1 Tax=Hippea maritima (strain ATCC 700847 / DSM 10411 / MH2) TaxID=760142 RepID=F2LUR3_HIPMA|nr:ATP-dependent zinc metalloprotease FtsH [Hippea maritima]AEA33518.1 ATP-dependent metalloprotease FtsH [Hippea maritima DSM 10411]